MRKCLLLVITLLCVFGVAWNSFAAPQVIKLAHVVNEKDGFHVAAMKFKELVEAQSEITIELHPNADLGDERTLLEGMQIGTIDMGVITNGPVSNFYPEIAVLELPFLFSSNEQVYKILDGPIGQELLENLSKVGLKGLAYAERGFRNLTNSVRPVQTPEDMKGLKIRVMENPVYIDTFKALGANATPMAWTEALTAMQQGTIDGQENPVNVLYAFKLYETQGYMSYTRHTYAPALFVMSLNLFNSLDADTQKLFKESAQAAAEHERQWDMEQEAQQLAALKENGMQVAEPDLKPFKEAVQPVYEKYGEKFGTYLKAIQEALNQ
ncbi:C4-dicarboxylate transport system (C4-dicarboxylate-binding protein) [Candidatus Vecturithrix granuli]|uniref:C4-dicarboxylate transport system (C4-dicarboxylate-binding protein) n=1 Tax=Vecturithrix granuli TaxID=1499967 RepID=A0A081C9S1_VECG1|nr:C4-dicarboxylate transport system (C4-dicarboxylate-binding protein) [Candidatus Vecturithrix granuli]